MKTSTASVVPGISNKAQVLATLKPITLSDGNGLSITLYPREYSTGSIGWSPMGGAKLHVQGHTVVPGTNWVIAKSKNL
jgi:hypothetical protein